MRVRFITSRNGLCTKESIFTFTQSLCRTAFKIQLPQMVKAKKKKLKSSAWFILWPMLVFCWRLNRYCSLWIFQQMYLFLLDDLIHEDIFAFVLLSDNIQMVTNQTNSIIHIHRILKNIISNVWSIGQCSLAMREFEVLCQIRNINYCI